MYLAVNGISSIKKVSDTRSLRLDLDADLDLRLGNIGSGSFKTVFWIRIRIRRVRMFRASRIR
jgi:hypothetical protein